MAALLCVALVALANTGEHSRAFQYLSGAVTAVVGVIKFAYAPVGAHLLADWRRFVGAIGAGVALAVISLLWFGVDVHRTYLEVLLWGVGQGSGSRPPTLWLPGYYKPLHWLPAAQWIRIAVSLLVAGYALLAPRSAHPLAFAVGVAAFPLLTPLAYTYYFVPLLPAIVVLLAGELERDGYPAVPVAGSCCCTYTRSASSSRSTGSRSCSPRSSCSLRTGCSNRGCGGTCSCSGSRSSDCARRRRGPYGSNAGGDRSPRTEREGPHATGTPLSFSTHPANAGAWRISSSTAPTGSRGR
ncbi:hypothetical protein ACFQL4_00820 [Halosimplex aquaticum]